MEDEWELLGTIPVDGGQCVVGDPAYVYGALERMRDENDYSTGAKDTGIGGSLAIIVSSGFGDGGYEVFQRKTKRTHVVAELRVVFVPEGKDRCETCNRYDHGRQPGCTKSLWDLKPGESTADFPCPACGGTTLVSV